MVQVSVTLSCKVHNEEGEALTTEDILAYLESEEQLSPISFLVDHEAASFMEFGTMPSKKGGKYPLSTGTSSKKPKMHGTKPLNSKPKTMKPSPPPKTEVQKSFRDWARARASERAANDGISTDKLGDIIYHVIMNTGCPPMPYVRPALYDTIDTLDGDFFQNGGSLMDVGKMIMEKAKSNLESWGIDPDDNIKNSMRVVPLDEAGEPESSNSEYEELWKEKDTGVGGKKAKPEERKR